MKAGCFSPVDYFFYSSQGSTFARFLRKCPKIFNYTLMSRFAFLPAATLLVLFLTWHCKRDNSSTAGRNDGSATDTVALQEFKKNSWKNNGCDLITEAEIQRVFQIDPKAATLNSKPLKDQAFCLHTWNRPDWKEREAHNEKNPNDFQPFRNSLVVQVFSYGTDQHARQQFEGLKRDRRDTYEETVTGIGEDALWGTTTVTLLVKKGPWVLSITLDAMDNPHDNLPKAKEVAELALQKL